MHNGVNGNARNENVIAIPSSTNFKAGTNNGERMYMGLMVIVNVTPDKVKVCAPGMYAEYRPKYIDGKGEYFMCGYGKDLHKVYATEFCYTGEEATVNGKPVCP